MNGTDDGHLSRSRDMRLLSLCRLQLQKFAHTPCGDIGNGMNDWPAWIFGAGRIWLELRRIYAQSGASL